MQNVSKNCIVLQKLHPESLSSRQDRVGLLCLNWHKSALHIDDYLEVTVMDGKIILEKPRRHLTLAERSIPYGGDLDIGEEFDWGEPQGSEEW